MDSLACVDPAKKKEIVVLCRRKFKILEVEIVRYDSIIPRVIARKLYSGLTKIGVKDRIGFENSEPGKTTVWISNARLANDHVRMSIRDGFVIAAESTKQKVSRHFALPKGRYGFSVEYLVDVIIKPIIRKAHLPPIVITV
jgi:hypothetical protein